MNRVIVTALIAAAFFLALHRPAFAITEFCPADLTYKAVGADEGTPKNAQLYGFDLSALTARKIAASLAFDTTAGWYTVDLPDVQLVPKVRHYNGDFSYVETDYLSPKIYVRFPQPLMVMHGWLLWASATGDGMGWEAKGAVACPPPPDSSPDQEKRIPKGAKAYTVDAKDDDHLSAPPDAWSTLLAAQPSKPLATTDCSEPFREAAVQNQVTPDYPTIMRGSGAGAAAVAVTVALNGNGTLHDAWVKVSSGYAAFDAAALAAAKASTYSGARSYCQPVPGSYLFRVTFDPNG
jgi:TonB family protein